MINISIHHELSLLAFWGIFVHWSMFLFQIPLLDNPSVPNIVKVLFTLVLSIAFYPFLKDASLRQITFFGKENFWMFIIVHALIGLTQGFMVKNMLQVLVGAGSLMTQSIGFTAIRYLDPTSAAAVGPFEKLISYSVLIILLSTQTLTPMIKGVYLSFLKLNLNNFYTLESFMNYCLSEFIEIFNVSIILAAPIVMINLVQTFILGIMAKMVPQVNILSVSFIFNIIVGLLAFLSISTEMFHKSVEIYAKELGTWYNYMAH